VIVVVGPTMTGPGGATLPTTKLRICVPMGLTRTRSPVTNGMPSSRRVR
jgi:hypothetical protein